MASDLPVPYRMSRLPRNKAGYVVPWFVAFIDGVPDFRVIRAGGIIEAVRDDKCWLCGDRLGRNVAFVIGPMCAVNRTSAEPPSHRDCAEYAAQVCPFLTNPKMVRRDNHKPEDATAPAGTMLTRNPGVALVWVTRNWRPFRVDNGILFYVGDPEATEWYAHGREATRDEVLASIESGLPLLHAEAEAEGPDSVAALRRMTERALQVVPA